VLEQLLAVDEQQDAVKGEQREDDGEARAEQEARVHKRVRQAEDAGAEEGDEDVRERLADACTAQPAGEAPVTCRSSGAGCAYPLSMSITHALPGHGGAAAQLRMHPRAPPKQPHRPRTAFGRVWRMNVQHVRS
jgi:hypothetical protein